MKKNLKYKILKTLLIISILITTFPFYVYADDVETEKEEILKTLNELENDISLETSNHTSSELNLNSRSCIILDRLSKEIIYGKNELNKVKMASTTKIMTAIIVIEKNELNKTIEISKKAANTGGSRLGLKTGDKISVRDLLYGLMLCSGNDAAVALAEYIGGSVDEFSTIMNNKAKELGLLNTNYESPHGLDSDNHYTTPYELALLSDYCLKNTTFTNLVRTQRYTVNINGHPKTLLNTNELLGNLNGVYGIKTGFTNGANRCLVTACKRGEMDIICVVLGADTKNFRTKDSIKLIEYTFKNFEYVNIENLINNEIQKWKTENPNYFSVEKGLSNNIDIKLENSPKTIIPISKNLKDTINININMNKYIDSPISVNDVIGNLNLSINSKEYISLNILSDTKIEKKDITNYLSDIFISYPNILVNGV